MVLTCETLSDAQIIPRSGLKVKPKIAVCRANCLKAAFEALLYAWEQLDKWQVVGMYELRIPKVEVFEIPRANARLQLDKLQFVGQNAIFFVN